MDSLNELSEVGKELQPQCSSIMKLCCTRELNKQTCRFSRALVKQRLDQTEFSLNKRETKRNVTGRNKSNKSNDDLYEQCLPGAESLQNESVEKSTTKLFTKIVLLTGSEIYSECCVACKLGLFSALNDYKCIIQKSIRPSKLFEETFYDCCFNLKRELDLASGKTVDIASIEALIYPELRQTSQTVPSAGELSQSSNNLPDDSSNAFRGNNELLTSQSFIDQEKVYFSNRLEQHSKMMDNIRTQIVYPDNGLAKELKDSKKVNSQSNSSSSPNCPEGMRLNEQNHCVFIDMCKEGLHNCKSDEQCMNRTPGFECRRATVVDNRHAKPNETISDQLQSMNALNSRPKLSNSVIQRRPNAQTSNQLAYPNPSFVRPRQPPNPIDHFNHPNQIVHNQFSRPYAQFHHGQFNHPNQMRTNQIKFNQRGFSKRKIDKCKIGNHNCDETQTCRKTENDFVCVSNRDLEEYDRLHPNSDDYQQVPTTTMSPSAPLENRLRNADAIQSNKICSNGFKLNTETNNCDDINECELGLHNCTIEYRCDNKIGSFMCVREQSCGTGYTYNVDTRQCDDINECKIGRHNCKEPYSCVNYEGSFRCELSRCKVGQRWLNNRCAQVICAPGFIYNSLNEKCMDIDECSVGVHSADLGLIISNRNEKNQRYDISQLERLPSGRYSACGKQEKCINNPGGFICQSSDDQESTNEVVNEQTQSNSSDQLTSKFISGRYLVNSNPFKPKCLPGERYDTGKKKCIVQGECKVISDTALKFIDQKSRTKYCIHKCTKINDEWSCECPAGYDLKRDGSRCAEIDECSLNSKICSNSSTTGQQHCVNTRGGYECVDISCPVGYVKNAKNML